MGEVDVLFFLFIYQFSKYCICFLASSNDQLGLGFLGVLTVFALSF